MLENSTLTSNTWFGIESFKYSILLSPSYGDVNLETIFCCCYSLQWYVEMHFPALALITQKTLVEQRNEGMRYPVCLFTMFEFEGAKFYSAWYMWSFIVMHERYIPDYRLLFSSRIAFRCMFLRRWLSACSRSCYSVVTLRYLLYRYVDGLCILEWCHLRIVDGNSRYF